MNKSIVAKNSFIKSFIWTLLTSLFGLSQTWLTILITYLVESIDFSLEIAIINGSFLFFMLTIITAITVDYFFTPPLSIPKWLENFAFVLYPLLMCLIIGLSHSSFIQNKGKLIEDNIIFFHYLMVPTALIFSLFSKFIMYYDEELNSKRSSK